MKKTVNKPLIHDPFLKQHEQLDSSGVGRNPSRCAIQWNTKSHSLPCQRRNKKRRLFVGAANRFDGGEGRAAHTKKTLSFRDSHKNRVSFHSFIRDANETWMESAARQRQQNGATRTRTACERRQNRARLATHLDDFSAPTRPPFNPQ